MKIIGSNEQSRKYIVEIDPLELDRLTGSGCGWNYSNGYVGKSFAITATWDKLKAIEHHKSELPRIANKLRALADLLQPIETEVPSEQRPLPGE